VTWGESESSAPGAMITSYSGTIQDGTLHGRGEAVYANGERFEGDWVYGKRHGQVRRPARSVPFHDAWAPHADAWLAAVLVMT
jgi:hypothetical protein